MYVFELQKTKDTSFIDSISSFKNDTVIYISMSGNNQVNLEKCLDCIYFDDREKFELLHLKREDGNIIAIVLMKNEKNT